METKTIVELNPPAEYLKSGSKMISGSHDTGGYHSYLIDRNAVFSLSESWLLVGQLPDQKGWLVHISVVRQQFDILMDRVLDCLVASALPFILPEHAERHGQVLDGRAGLLNVGKVVTIFVADEAFAISLITQLIDLTEDIIGPEVVTAVHVSTSIAISFGSLLPDHTRELSRYCSLRGFDKTAFIKDDLRRNGVSWPFNELVDLKKLKLSKLIRGAYIAVQSLKSDPKGNVLKCIRLNRIYNMEWCVLKQGKRHQCYDDYGRDISDRIQSQFKMHLLLQDTARIPRVIDTFTLTGDCYLVLEHIDGIPFSAKINQAHQGAVWLALHIDAKTEIIGYLLQVIAVLDGFHQSGIVHRDINPGNFLVTDDGHVTAIDVELAYNLNDAESLPPFTSGTAGYISPQQMRNELPAFSDDIFGLGALLIKAFTGFSPNKWEVTSSKLQDDLQFFIGCPQMASLITAALSVNRDLRPDLIDVSKALDSYKEYLLCDSSEQNTPQYLGTLPDEDIVNTIKSGLHALTKSPMVGARGEWISQTLTDDKILANEFMDYSWSPGFYSGSSGVLYLFAKASIQGIVTDEMIELMDRNFQMIDQRTNSFVDLPPDLWNGSYGLAIAFKTMADAGLMENNLHQNNALYQLLIKPCLGVGLADGMAGQGLALLYCSDLPKFPSLYGRLSVIATAISALQEPDGSWLVSKNNETKKLKMLGLGHGVAGILLFLLEYQNKYGNNKTEAVITKGLNWLASQRVLVNDHLIWPVNVTSKMIEPWLEYGFTGVALVFIKAFKILKDPVYKTVASDALSAHPEFISSNHLTIANGIAGVGEVYLEAFKVFGDQEWKERADHIGSVLMHNCRKIDGETLYWLDGHQSRPSAGLMTGSAGILNFLLRLQNPFAVKSPTSI